MDKDKPLLFKEEFNWDERKMNEEENKTNNQFYKGVTFGIGGCMLFLLLMSIIQLI